jgi:hypothetical protein
MSLLLSTPFTLLLEYVQDGKLYAIEPYRERLLEDPELALDLLHRAASSGRAEILQFLVDECGVDPNDDAEDEWRTLHNAIESEDPRTVRVLLDLARRKPDVNAIFTCVPYYGLTDRSEVLQHLLDRGACESGEYLDSLIQRLSDRGCDYRDDFGGEVGKQGHALQTAFWFMKDIVINFRKKLKLRKTFGYQRDRYADACISLAALDVPVLVMIEICDELVEDWERLDLYHRWLISHRVQRFYARVCGM